MHAVFRSFAAPALFLLASLPGIPARAQDTYTENGAPRPLLLKPGTTVITGGVTEAGMADAFYLKATAGGTLTARLRYSHRSPNLLLGVTEQAHLSAEISRGDYNPPDSYFQTSGAASLTSSFFLQNGENTLRAASFPVAEPADAMRVLISAPAGKTNPAYTLEVDYHPPADDRETAGNESAAAAVLLDAAIPGRLSGSIHTAVDEDWFRFAVPEGETLFLYTVSDGVTPPQRLQTQLLTPAGTVLQSAQAQTATYVETAGAGGREYLLRIRSTDGYAQTWSIFWRLEDRFEPNNSAATATPLGTLQAGGRLEAAGLTTGVAGGDYFTFTSGLPAGTPILIAVPGDPSVSPGFLPSVFPSAPAGGATTELRGGRGYSVVTTSTGGTVVFSAAGLERRYRVLVKAESAYDRWSQDETLAENLVGTYIPPHTDYDGDGVPAALEWALRGSLTAPDASVSAPFFDGSSWRINIAMPQSGTITPIRVRESGDLLGWTDVPALRTNFGGSFIPAGRTATAAILLTKPGAARNWVRLEVDE